MLIKLIYTELKKLKRSPIWLAFLFIPIVPAVLGTLNYMNNLELLQDGWYDLWTQHTLFTCYFFLPVTLGIYCSYLMRLEHGNHNWNKLLSAPVRIWEIYVSKLASAAVMLILSEVWIAVLYVASGYIIGLPKEFPLELINWTLGGILGGAVMLSLQLLISLIIKSFALPVGISLVGGISGLVALAKSFGHIYPYSLMAYGMESNAPQKLIESGYVPFIVVSLLWIAALTIIGSIAMSKAEL